MLKRIQENFVCDNSFEDSKIDFMKTYKEIKNDSPIKSLNQKHKIRSFYPIGNAEN